MKDRKTVYDNNYEIVRKILARIAPTMSIRGFDPDWSLWSHNAGSQATVETVGDDFMGLLAISMGYDWQWDFKSHPVERQCERIKSLEKAVEDRDKFIQNLEIMLAKKDSKPGRQSK